MCYPCFPLVQNSPSTFKLIMLILLFSDSASTECDLCCHLGPIHCCLSLVCVWQRLAILGHNLSHILCEGFLYVEPILIFPDKLKTTTEGKATVHQKRTTRLPVPSSVRTYYNIGNKHILSQTITPASTHSPTHPIQNITLSNSGYLNYTFEWGFWLIFQQ